MPGLDGTGPVGGGPLTGRRGGYCRSGIPLRRAFYRAGPIRRGSGMGGFGRGFRWQYLETGLPRWERISAIDPSFRAEDKAILQETLEMEVKALEEQLNDVKAYLESLMLDKPDKSEEVNSD
ncbi:MAG: DUF5320 domain-containing protein [Halobacteriota archaeon]